jgi:hypothetical protein
VCAQELRQQGHTVTVSFAKAELLADQLRALAAGKVYPALFAWHGERLIESRTNGRRRR